MAPRKTKYTPERVTTIEQAIEVGLSYEHAAALAGVSADTLSRWQAQHADFAERIARAEARGALRNFQRVSSAGTNDWRAAAWILEHRHPAHYGKQHLDVTLNGQVVLQGMAERAAAEFGIDAAEVLAEVERMLAVDA